MIPSVQGACSKEGAAAGGTSHLKRILSLLVFLALLSWAWGSAPPRLTRGPYLQSTSATTLTLVCQTDAAAVLNLRYGIRAGPPWDFESPSSGGTEHVFELTGLRPEMRYAYELSSGSSVLASGEPYAFRTAPPEQSRAPFRFVAWGDSGTGDLAQREVAARMEAVSPVPDLALGLGDLVYEDGEWENYDPRLFAPYAGLLRRMTFWPTMGNHDIRTEQGAPYFAAYYLPTTSGAPGHPSDTELYYSFDYGMAHFTCADSEYSTSDPGSPMYEWLADDLESARARGKRWLFVFMHHPPYSHGTHNSDQEQELIVLHDNLVPLFESQGVDLVLTGHSHVYERSFLARDDAVLQTDLGDYSKIGSPDGTIYLVSGCGGETGTGPLDHPLMARSYGDVAGFSLLDVSWEEVRGSFVERDGRTTDLFTVRKAADVVPPRIAALEARAADQLALVFDEPVAAGTGPAGAENPANYAIEPARVVLEATLDSDQRTVFLRTGDLEPNRGYELSVFNLLDMAGNGAELSAPFLLAQDPTRSTSTPVAQGSVWRYLKGSAEPPADWAQPAFDDSSWSPGPAGFGFGDGDDATRLDDMRNQYVSVYLRTSFEVDDPAEVAGLQWRVDYDDGFVAFLNGVEVARANVPLGQTSTTLASDDHEADGFESFDASASLFALRSGTNVLAVEGHNSSLDSSDFSLHPELNLTFDHPGGPPRARATTEVHTANVPARIAFSSALSSGQERQLVGARWHFGDGSPGTPGTEVDHIYDRTGVFNASLTVTDEDGAESIARLPIRIHDQGSAPVAALSASSLAVLTGEAVSFASLGSLDPDGGTLFVSWDFGDPASGPANRSQDMGATHVYASAGSYTVTLTVVDDEGSGETDTAVITVRAAAAPTASFTVSPSGADPLELSFTDRSAGDVTSWSWEFGDGGSSSLPSPQHLYAAAGMYTVRLTVSGPGGSDSSEDVVHVGPSGGSGSSGGGGCSVAPIDGHGPRGDSGLALGLATVLLVLLQRSRRRAWLAASPQPVTGSAER